MHSANRYRCVTAPHAVHRLHCTGQLFSSTLRIPGLKVGARFLPPMIQSRRMLYYTSNNLSDLWSELDVVLVKSPALLGASSASHPKEAISAQETTVPHLYCTQAHCRWYSTNLSFWHLASVGRLLAVLVVAPVW